MGRDARLIRHNRAATRGTEDASLPEEVGERGDDGAKQHPLAETKKKQKKEERQRKREHKTQFISGNKTDKKPGIERGHMPTHVSSKCRPPPHTHTHRSPTFGNPSSPTSPPPPLPLSFSGWMDGWMVKASGAEPATVAGCCTTSWAAHEQLRRSCSTGPAALHQQTHAQGRHCDIMFPATDSVRFLLS